MEALRATERIEATYRSYLRTTYAPRQERWRASFERALAGELDLVRGPYLQATPPFVPGATLAALVAQGVLDKGFASIAQATFPQDRPLHRHQELAIRKSLAGRNLLVATGTGSGKTEAVLFPVLHALAATIPALAILAIVPRWGYGTWRRATRASLAAAPTAKK